LLGIPFAGDLAVIGTRFGLKGTPGWYYNIRADPAMQVIYRNKKVAAVAREAQGEEPNLAARSVIAVARGTEVPIPQCRLVQRDRRVSPDEFVVLVVLLVFHGE
jgi:hypothetical protein